MFIYLLIILIIFLFVWVVGVLKTNDFNVPTKKLSKFKNILIIFPHPDDESLSVSGLVKIAKKVWINTSLLVLTKGGAGESSLSGTKDLKIIREEEMRKSASVIGINNLIQLDFPDGKLVQYSSDISKIISNQIKKLKPDLVITYDLSGLYGHEDHIVTSEITTNLIKNKFKNIKLWYVSYPKKVLDMISLPTHMAKDKNFLINRKAPSFKIFIGLNFIYSYLSVLAHKSQYKSFRSEELKYIPLWLVYSTQIFEYYYEAN